MTFAPLRYVPTTRPFLLASVALQLMLIGCVLQPRPELEAYRRSFYRIRFDSTMSSVGAPRAVYDTTLTLLTDVVEIGGQALGSYGDTIAVAPSYVLIADRKRPGEGRTIRRSGRQALPDNVLVPVQPGVRIEPWDIGPSRSSLLIAPMLGALTMFLLLRCGRH
jgi:hypothetical protein